MNDTPLNPITDSFANLLAQTSGELVGLSFVNETLTKQSLNDNIFKNCDFSGSDLSRTSLEGSKFVGCKAYKTKFKYSHVGETKFLNCNFAMTDWEGARFSSTTFVGCKLTGANFNRSHSLGLSFEECVLVNAILKNFSFRKVTLLRNDFSEADLGGSDFRDAIFTECSLREASLRQAKFKGADLRGCDLGSLSLSDAVVLKGAVVSRHQATELLRGMGIIVQ